ncbi:MAG: carbamoyltransferase N-terminal domain-containing protein, partial [Thermodesulfovibrionales bacterium]
MITLGINNMHDASAVIVIDGKVIAAAEEERFTRVKHTRGFPKYAIAFCLDYAGIQITDVDLICAAWKPWVMRVRITQVVKSVLKSPALFMAKAARGAGQMKGEWSELFRLRSLFEGHFGKGKYKIEFVDHHLAHAASAFLCSPFDRAAILTIDGAGEAETTVSWLGEGNSIKKLDAISLPHSLGQFYSAVTGFLGFKIQSDEYKVMGLAAYGEPVYADYLRKHAIKLLPEGRYEVDPYFIDYHLARKGVFRKTTTDIFGRPRTDETVNKQHADIAASAQVIIEESIFHIANHLYKKTKAEKLCLAGGVAFNCVVNGKLFNNTPFKEIFVQPAAGDSGSALGAALYGDMKHTARQRAFIMKSAYLGPSFSATECET